MTDEHFTEPSLNGVLDFDSLQPASARVRYGGKEYVLREASAAAAARYNDANVAATRYDEEGRVVGFEKLSDNELLLISLCLFETAGGKEAPVPLGVVRGWPNRVTKALYDWVKERSDLGADQSLEAIERQIASLQKKLTRLRKAAGGEGSSKNPPGASTLPADTTAS